MLAGIVVSVIFWSRIARRDSRLLTIYFAALTGAFVGAKIVYFFAEGYQHIGAPDFWLQLATGKTILGGLLGGFIAVEVTKQIVGYRGITGDWFAIITPVGIILGRLGCLFHGCCQGIQCNRSWYTLEDQNGIARWPSVPVEMLFNVIAVIAFVVFRKRNILPGQLFHIYLISYGAFRFLHEFIRNEPHVLGPITGYQFAAFTVFALGTTAFIRRRKAAVATKLHDTG
jgi:phosphatidylglycerol:prolipoprotein diacylglycerol transferase